MSQTNHSATNLTADEPPEAPSFKKTNLLIAPHQVRQALASVKRHVLLILLRVLGTFLVIVALPIAADLSGFANSGDGPTAFGFLISFALIGLGAEVIYWLTGSVIQYLFRNRSTRTLVVAEVALLFLFVVVLIIAGVSAKYTDTLPPGA
jgi:hypothetical protein